MTTDPRPRCPYCTEPITWSGRGPRPESRAHCGAADCRKAHRARLERERLAGSKAREEIRAAVDPEIAALAARVQARRAARPRRLVYREEVATALGDSVIDQSEATIPGKRLRPSHVKSLPVETAWREGFVPDGYADDPSTRPEHRRRKSADERRQDDTIEAWLSTLDPEEAAIARASLEA